IAATVYFKKWFIKRGIEGRVASARLIRRQVQLVTQSEIQGQLSRDLPVILDEEAVIGCPHAAQADAVSVGRTVNIAKQEIREALEIDLTTPVVVRVTIVDVINDLSACSDAVPAARNGESISEVSWRLTAPHVAQ